MPAWPPTRRGRALLVLSPCSCTLAPHFSWRRGRRPPYSLRPGGCPSFSPLRPWCRHDFCVGDAGTPYIVVPRPLDAPPLVSLPPFVCLRRRPSACVWCVSGRACPGLSRGRAPVPRVSESLVRDGVEGGRADLWRRDLYPTRLLLCGAVGTATERDATPGRCERSVPVSVLHELKAKAIADTCRKPALEAGILPAAPRPRRAASGRGAELGRARTMARTERPSHVRYTARGQRTPWQSRLASSPEIRCRMRRVSSL